MVVQALGFRFLNREFRSRDSFNPKPGNLINPNPGSRLSLNPKPLNPKPLNP